MVNSDSHSGGFISGNERDSNVDDGSKASWDDMVFEKRNREYGAYVLRKDYSGAVLIGFLITAILVTAIILYPLVAKFFSDDKPVLKAKPVKLVYTELSAPPPVDKPKPPPPNVILPRLKQTIRFVPPKIVKEAVRETTPVIEEIKENETASIAVEGADVVFEEPVEEITSEDENEIFMSVEQDPEFDGGYDAMMRFIRQNLKYPANALRMEIQGTVYVTFVVGKDGSVREAKVLRGILKECDAEAIRVVQSMPSWTPGKQNGRNVNVRYTIPVRFIMKSPT